MAERRKRPPVVMALARESPARPERRTGLWHRPELLDLISDALLLFAAAALGWALVTWALAKPLFPLHRLELSAPPVQVTQAQLEFVARTAIHGNFFTARLEDVRTAFEKLPWVRRAGVRRLWPDGLELSLEEHEAVAYWRDTGGDGNVRLINRQGEVFAASSDAAMPEFSGPPGMASAILDRHVIYTRILHPLEARLARLELSARGAWQLWLDDGLRIVLGREQERPPLDERLERFVTAWPRLQDSVEARIARADLRYPSGFALTPASDNINTNPRPAAGSNAK